VERRDLTVYDLALMGVCGRLEGGFRVLFDDMAGLGFSIFIGGGRIDLLLIPLVLVATALVVDTSAALGFSAGLRWGDTGTGAFGSLAFSFGLEGVRMLAART
jgi:hypothetical protein